MAEFAISAGLGEATPRPNRLVIASALPLLTALIGLGGMTEMPMDGHEVLVVQTAQEMLDRSRWIVPVFNGEPRLKKPPMSYWTTSAVAWASSGGADRVRVLPWHARIVSVLAGAWLVATAQLLGRRMFSARAGLLAGVFVATSLGMIRHVASARPDMLYAAWCASALACHVLASQARGAWGRRLSAQGVWVCAGLAMLTKGPHVPVMMAAGVGVYHAISRTPWRRLVATGAPITGPILAAAIAGWWWWAVNDRVVVEFGQTLAGTELTGSRMTIDPLGPLSLYYPLGLLGLLLPWSLLAPFMLSLRRGATDQTAAVRLLVCVALAVLIGLGFGEHRRTYYLLPILPVLGVLLGAGVDAAISRRVPLARALEHPAVPLALLGVIAVLGLSLAALAPAPAAAMSHLPGLWITLLALALVLAAPVFADDAQKATTHLCLLAAALAAMAWFGGDAMLWRSEHRGEWARLSQRAAEAAGSPARLVTFGVHPDLAVYHAGPGVAEALDPADLIDLARASPDGRLFALVAVERAERVPRSLNPHVIDRMRVAEREEADVLMELSIVAEGR